LAGPAGQAAIGGAHNAGLRWGKTLDYKAWRLEIPVSVGRAEAIAWLFRKAGYRPARSLIFSAYGWPLGAHKKIRSRADFLPPTAIGGQVK
jgi:hypothetical protein